MSSKTDLDFEKKVIDELTHFKYLRPFWKNISYTKIQKDSRLQSYDTFKKYLDFVKVNKLAKFSASLNYPLLGIITAFVHVKLQYRRDWELFMERLHGHDFNFIQNIYFIGAKDITFLLRLRAPSFWHLQQFTTFIRQSTVKYIRSSLTNVVAHTFLDEGVRYPDNEFSPNLQLDSLDWDILWQLQRNAHISYAEIAAIVKKSPSTISKRIQQLKKNNIILGYHLVRKWTRIDESYWPASAICELTTSTDFNENSIFTLDPVEKKEVHIRYLYGIYGQYNKLFSFSTRSLRGMLDLLHHELVNVNGVLTIRNLIINKADNRTVRLFYP